MSVIRFSWSLPRALLWIIGVSLALHLIGLFLVLILSGPGVLSFGDGVWYLELAKNLRDGLGFVSMQTNGLAPEVFRTPGLPFLLVPFVESQKALVAYSALLATVASAVLPLCTWRIAREFLTDRTALLAAGVIAFEPLTIFYSWFPFGEIPFLIFALLATTLFIEASYCQKKQWRFILTIIAGLAAGYAVLIRPANFLLFIVGALLSAVLWYRKKEFIIRLAVASAMAVVVLLPWYVHVHAVTGTYSLSGTGWRNVYTDYLASLRSVKNDSSYDVERAFLKNVGSQQLGLSNQYDLNNPANSSLLRQASIRELTQNVGVVLKLEPMLLFSFFTNDGYYYYAARLGFLPSYTGPNISSTALLLKNGTAALPPILGQLKKQFFVPVFGRMITVALLIATILGAFWIRNRRAAILLSALVLLAAIDSTALGLGVEARLRLAVFPLIAILAAAGIDALLNIRAGRRTVSS